MAFEDVIPNRGHQKYWKPEVVGESIEGSFCEIRNDDYGNELIVLDVGNNTDGETLKTVLPSHYGLRIYYENINLGDYLRVELVGIKESKNGQNPRKIYKVQVDPDRFVEYDQ